MGIEYLGSVHLQRFGELIRLVGEPRATINYRRPGFEGRIKQEPKDVFDFQVMHLDKHHNWVTFGAKVNSKGELVQPIHYEKDDLIIRPTPEDAQQLFFNEVVNPFHKVLFL